MADAEFHTHEFPPFYRPDSRLLILGSFPSVKSREAGFYYGHPRNRFWPLLAEVFHDRCPGTREEKEALLARHHVALWDAIGSCEIRGSSDASIRNVVPTDIPALLAKTQVRRIFTNGRLADKYYKKYNEGRTGIAAVCLPSTSPANAAVDFPSLLAKWREALLCLTRVHLTFTGRVQHIGFRVTAFDTARKIGLTGWVRNCERFDQTEAEVQGSREQVETFVMEMKGVKRFAIRSVAGYGCPVKGDETYFDIR